MIRAHEFASRGENLSHAVLNNEAVFQIRKAKQMRENLRLKIKNELSNESLAKKYGVHVRTIEKVLSYSTWFHVKS